jgi:hypothetical protein
LFFIPNLCYKFGTTASSSDPDDALQPSGIESSINPKDLRQFERAMTTDPTNPNFNITAYRPAHYSFYNANAYDHRTKAVQGVFPYCVMLIAINWRSGIEQSQMETNIFSFVIINYILND